MSEQDPLLPSREAEHDIEAASDGGSDSSSWKERVGEALESSTTHKIVITLIIIDALCVLSDLSYTLLSSNCTSPSEPESPLWLDILSEISTAITTLFLVEIPLALWSFGVQYYNPIGSTVHAALHLFDALIIVTTFVLEVGLRGRERELVSLLVVLRLWRLVKLVGGVAVGAGEIEDETLKELAETKQELQSTRSALVEARRQISELQAVLEAHSTTDEQ